jgi:SH3-like domain-containing protein
MVLKAFALALVALATASAGHAQEQRRTPYWASIAASKAMMRTGPGKAYPATWLYTRSDLPIRVIEVYPNWRKIQDPGGTTGWMLVTLLSDTRTALVTGAEPHPLYEKPDENSKIAYMVEPGVVGRLSKCTDNWCELNVKGKHGYIRTDAIWGVDPGESF